MKHLLILILTVNILACAGNYQKPSVYERDGLRRLDRAKKALTNGDYERSLIYTEEAIAISKSNNIPSLKIKSLIEKSNLHLYLKQFDLVHPLILEAKEVSQKEVKELLPFVLYNEAVYFWETGKKEEAKKTLSDIKDPLPELKPAYYNLVSLFEFDANNIDAAKESALSAIKYAEKIDNFEQMSYSNKILAEIAFVKNSYEEAIEKAKKALEIDRKVANREAILWDCEFLGKAYKRAGDKEKAFYFFYQGYELSAAIGNKVKRDYFIEEAYQLLK